MSNQQTKQDATQRKKMFLDVIEHRNHPPGNYENNLKSRREREREIYIKCLLSNRNIDEDFIRFIKKNSTSDRRENNLSGVLCS